MSDYDVEIAPHSRPNDWQFLAGPFLSADEARKYIDWQREIDAKPPKGRYHYRMAARAALTPKPTEPTP